MTRSADHVLRELNLGHEITTSFPVLDAILTQVKVPADRYLWLTFYDGKHDVKSVKYNHTMNSHNLFIHSDYTFGSDPDPEIYLMFTTRVHAEWIDEPAYHKQKQTEFFRYHTIIPEDQREKEDFSVNYDLEDFQVFDKQTEEMKAKQSIPCFHFALEQAGLDHDVASSVICDNPTTAASLQFMKRTARRLNIQIAVKVYTENEKRFNFNLHTFGTGPRYLIGVVAHHCFAIKPTAVTLHAIQFPKYLTHPNWPSIRIKNGCLRTHLDPITLANAPFLANNQYMKLERLTTRCFEDEFFREIGLNEEMKLHPKYGQSPFIYEKQPMPFKTVYFDLETMPEDDNFHIPYLSSWQILGGEIQAIFGLNCARQMLDSFPPEANKKKYYLVWAHNAGFDVRFLIPYLSHFLQGVIETGNNLKQVKGIYKNSKGHEIMLCFKYTKAFINERLSKFPAMFPQVGLKLAKESFPHQLMNRRTYDKPLHLADIAESYLEQRLRVLPKDADEYLVREAEIAAKEDYDTLVTNAKAIGAIIVDGTQFDTVKYAIHYCRKDVEVLATCFEAFRKMMLDKFGQDVYRLVSLPSLAFNYLNNRGCYDGCYALSGAVLAFVRGAIVGGCCMTRGNQKHHFMMHTYTEDKEEGNEKKAELKTNVVLDSDVNSLYPAAMAQLEGFAKGKPKFFQISDKQKQIPPSDYYIARVLITGLNKKRAFPLQSIKDENGVRQFTNDLVGKKLIIDKTAFEDLVKFQSVSYKVIEGVYWDQGFNSKICEVMPELYNERMKLKAQGNPLQQCVKMLMNASFGKKIQKPIVTQKQFIVGVDGIKKYTKKNICKLLSRTTVSENVSLFEETKSVSQHFSPAHLGVQQAHYE